MSQTSGFIVKNVTTVGSAEGGEYIRLSIELDGLSPTLFIPYKMFPALLTALIAAGSAAHTDMLARKGSEASVLEMVGGIALRPTEFDLVLSKDGDEDLIVIRLKKDGAPMMLAALSREGAENLAREILSTLASPLPKPRASH